MIAPVGTIVAQPRPTAADRLCASILISRLNQVSNGSDTAIYAAAAISMMEHRMSCDRAFSERQNVLRQAALELVIWLHASVGHEIPAGHTVPNKPLHELLTAIENALWPLTETKSS